jgi:hypothetical protein
MLKNHNTAKHLKPNCFQVYAEPAALHHQKWFTNKQEECHNTYQHGTKIYIQQSKYTNNQVRVIP